MTTEMRDLFEKIKRLQTMKGLGIRIHDSPGGRQICREGEDAQGEAASPSGGYYDVITIGGYYQDPPGKYPTVNDYYGEKNHVLSSKRTAAQVNAGSWTWNPGGSEVHFAIAAIPYNTRQLIPGWDIPGDWWNPKVPARLLFARAWAQNATGAAITLTLTIGTIQE